MVEKGENASYQHFLLFTQCFQKISFPEVLEVGIVWQRDNVHVQFLIFCVLNYCIMIHCVIKDILVSLPSDNLCLHSVQALPKNSLFKAVELNL